jgi:hypothetical protein
MARCLGMEGPKIHGRFGICTRVKRCDLMDSNCGISASIVPVQKGRWAGRRRLQGPHLVSIFEILGIWDHILVETSGRQTKGDQPHETGGGYAREHTHNYTYPPCTKRGGRRVTLAVHSEATCTLKAVQRAVAKLLPRRARRLVLSRGRRRIVISHRRRHHRRRIFSVIILGDYRWI